MKKMY